MQTARARRDRDICAPVAGSRQRWDASRVILGFLETPVHRGASAGGTDVATHTSRFAILPPDEIASIRENLCRFLPGDSQIGRRFRLEAERFF